MNILLTGGRAPATLDLLRSLSRRGHSVFVAESMAYSLCGYSSLCKRTFRVPPPRQSPLPYIQALGQIIESEGIDLLIPTCEEIFYISRLKEHLPAWCFVWVDDFKKMQQVHSKFTFQELVRSLGLASPLTFRVTHPLQLDEAIAQVGQKSNRVVLKPEYSRFAARVEILDSTVRSHDRSLKEVTQNLNDRQPWLVQEFIEGTEWCTYSWAHRGVLLAHSTYDHEFTAGKGAGICFESQNDPVYLEWVNRFVEKTQWTGQIAFDFVKTADGTLYPLECNPRATSGVHFLVQCPEYLDRICFIPPQPLAIQTVIQPQPGAKAKLGIALWTFGLSQFRSLKKVRSWATYILYARDVIFDLRDGLPFFGQLFTFIKISLTGLRQKQTALEASTSDIEWNGGHI